MAENTGEQFLHQKNPTLHISNLVEHEVERQKIRGEEISQKPADKIHAWMDLLWHTHTSHRDDPRVLDRIKESYYKIHVIKEENIPESYFDNQKRIAREQGHGDIEITSEMRQQTAEILISDQKSTFDPWLEYLTSSDSDYIPTWAKYWVFTGMLKLGTYDKQKHAFSNRDKNTVAPFPDLNREALAYVVDKLIKKVDKVNIEDNDPELKKLLESSNFGKLYAWAIEKVTPASKENLINTAGKWVKYDQGSDHMPLVTSLQGHGTGWCTAGESTAKTQLDNGDFYVYYSHDQNGQATIPRIAIRMDGKDTIGEVRGIADNQNLDPYVNQILETKLKEFGQEGERYKEKNADMNYLTQIDHKQKLGQELSKEELRFLYEIDKKIQGFGYERDPRIRDILDKRISKIDAPIVLNCQPSEIAWSQNEINKNTKAYVGPLFEGFFKDYKNLENIYTSFPEGKIRREPQEAGEKSYANLSKELQENEINVGTYAQQIMKKSEFTTLKSRETFDLIHLKVSDLGFINNPTTEELYKKAIELGLDLCPPEIGPELRLKYKDQPLYEWKYIAMKPILGSNGDPDVFELARDGDGLWLNSTWAYPGSHWRLGGEMVFCLRK